MILQSNTAAAYVKRRHFLFTKHYRIVILFYQTYSYSFRYFSWILQCQKNFREWNRKGVPRPVAYWYLKTPTSPPNLPTPPHPHTPQDGGGGGWGGTFYFPSMWDLLLSPPSPPPAHSIFNNRSPRGINLFLLVFLTTSSSAIQLLFISPWTNF